MQDYKPNSNKYKSEQRKEREKRAEKIVQGNVRRKKKSEVSRLKDIFISEDIEDVKTYIVMDVVVPTIKNTIADVVNMFLFGDTSKRNKNHNTVSYSSYSSGRSGNNNRRVVSNRYNFDDYYFDSRGEAEEVLDRMDELIDSYGAVTVGDFYDMIGITGKYTDNNYGWTNISRASVQRTRDGYSIDLPRVKAID